MSARVESAASPHRKLIQSLLELPRHVLLGVAEPLETHGSIEQTVRLLAGIVTIHTAIDGRPASTSEALRWFFGDPTLRSGLSRSPFEKVGWTEQPDEQLVGLLPYVLDPFGLTTRRALMAGRACRHERASRKRFGAFYTPGDVARVLANEVITPRTRRVLDPACGAGVFLRAAFTQLSSTLPAKNAISCLHGVDIDAAAIDACALVLTHDWLMREPSSGDELPADRFQRVRSQLCHADALALFAQSSPSSVCNGGSERVACPPSSQFDAILTNPPFAPVGACMDDVSNGFESLRAARNPAGLNMMWPFWELTSRAVTNRGRVGIVLPLSSAYLSGDAARAAREAVFKRGTWEMRFFDRAPDALFGDDVKQRVALAFRRPGAPGVVRTSGMRRWSANRRAAALRTDVQEGIDLPVQSDLILKIGSAVERDAVTHLQSFTGTLGDATTHMRLMSAIALDRSEQAIAIAPTAYNWIGAYRDNAIAVKARRAAAGKLVELVFADRVLADAAYATIVSRVFLWWWRITGDLFHISRSILLRAPFPLHLCAPEQLDRLAAAGRACWCAAQATPITSVNRGVVTVAYTPTADHEALDTADREVGVAFGLNPEFVRFVRDDAVRLRSAGRSC
jgi:N-6 DNA Methylase